MPVLEPFAVEHDSAVKISTTSQSRSRSKLVTVCRAIDVHCALGPVVLAEAEFPIALRKHGPVMTPLFRSAAPCCF